MSWVDFLSENTKLNPSKVALVDQGTGLELTYANVWEQTLAASTWLYQHEVGEGDRVALLAKNRLEHLILLFACAKVGAIFVPLNFRLAHEELRETLELIQPSLFLASSEFHECFPESLSLENITWEDMITKPADDFPKVSLDKPLLMLFTSGSTGQPKGVLLHGRMLLTNQIETIQAWGLRSDDHTLVETPFFHTGGYNVLCLPLLYLGGKITLAESFKPDNVFDAIEKLGVSVYFGVPTMFQLLREHPRFEQVDFTSLRFCISGGAACPAPLIKDYQSKSVMFKQGFGLTEVGPNCFLLDELDAVRKAGSIGRPMPHSKVLVLKTDGTPATAHEPGELLIKGEHVCAGHFKREEEYQKSLFDGYFRTGDLVEFDDEGFFYVVGRLKDMYISGGENVYPGEVERKCAELDGVDQVVVVAVPDEKWGEVGFAWLQGPKTDLFDSTQLKELLSQKISRYKRPHHLRWVNEWVCLPNGKIDRVYYQNEAQKQMSSQGETV